MEKPGSEEFGKHEQWMRDKYPDAQWVSQTEFNRTFNSLKPVERMLVDVNFGFMALKLPGRLLMVTQNVG